MQINSAVIKMLLRPHGTMNCHNLTSTNTAMPYEGTKISGQFRISGQFQHNFEISGQLEPLP